MGQIRLSRSPVATTSNPSPLTLTVLPSPRKWRVAPSMQLDPSRSDVSICERCLMTTTMRPSAPRVLMRSIPMEIPNG